MSPTQNLKRHNPLINSVETLTRVTVIAKFEQDRESQSNTRFLTALGRMGSEHCDKGELPLQI
ncbi:12917_t:CDS:2 [Funneliformis mosseae]|uniref:12917_t:CDS:1 n=1 Tax=Funneliformis mosseae TaxID=27381 RepID=A0A9N9C282_FUNMO|nr:12917_t:CDS:2 [Funneliformis mosseae]